MKTIPLLAAGLLLAGCGAEAPEEAPSAAEAVDVIVTPAWTAAAHETHLGTLGADETVSVSTRIAAAVQAVLVDEGEPVRAGQLLVRLDGVDVAAALAEARAAHGLAQRTFERVAALESDGAASRDELDRASAALAAAGARVDAAEAQQAYAELRAPFDGWVVTRSTDPGTLALPGHPLLELQTRRARTVRVDLPSEVWEAAHAGAPARVFDGASGWAADAVVARRAPAIGASNRRFRVELSLAADSDAPLPGTQVDVLLEGAGEETVWVPLDALVRRGQLTGVWTVGDDTLRLRWIRSGIRDGDRIEVLAGVVPSDVVVRRPGAGLQDGWPVARATVQAPSTEEVSR